MENCGFTCDSLARLHRIVVTLLSSLFIDRTGYYCVLLYCSAMNALFLVRLQQVATLVTFIYEFVSHSRC